MRMRRSVRPSVALVVLFLLLPAAPVIALEPASASAGVGREADLDPQWVVLPEGYPLYHQSGWDDPPISPDDGPYGSQDSPLRRIQTVAARGETIGIQVGYFLPVPSPVQIVIEPPRDDHGDLLDLSGLAFFELLQVCEATYYCIDHAWIPSDGNLSSKIDEGGAGVRLTISAAQEAGSYDGAVGLNTSMGTSWWPWSIIVGDFVLPTVTLPTALLIDSEALESSSEVGSGSFERDKFEAEAAALFGSVGLPAPCALPWLTQADLAIGPNNTVGIVNTSAVAARLVDCSADPKAWVLLPLTDLMPVRIDQSTGPDAPYFIWPDYPPSAWANYTALLANYSAAVSPLLSASGVGGRSMALVGTYATGSGHSPEKLLPHEGRPTDRDAQIAAALRQGAPELRLLTHGVATERLLGIDTDIATTIDGLSRDEETSLNEAHRQWYTPTPGSIDSLPTSLRTSYWAAYETGAEGLFIPQGSNLRRANGVWMEPNRFSWADESLLFPLALRVGGVHDDPDRQLAGSTDLWVHQRGRQDLAYLRLIEQTYGPTVAHRFAQQGAREGQGAIGDFDAGTLWSDALFLESLREAMFSLLQDEPAGLEPTVLDLLGPQWQGEGTNMTRPGAPWGGLRPGQSPVLWPLLDLEEDASWSSTCTADLNCTMSQPVADGTNGPRVVHAAWDHVSETPFPQTYVSITLNAQSPIDFYRHRFAWIGLDVRSDGPLEELDVGLMSTTQGWNGYTAAGPIAPVVREAPDPSGWVHVQLPIHQPQNQQLESLTIGVRPLDLPVGEVEELWIDNISLVEVATVTNASYRSPALSSPDLGRGWDLTLLHHGGLSVADYRVSVQMRSSPDGSTWGPWARLSAITPDGGDETVGEAEPVRFALLAAEGAFLQVEVAFDGLWLGWSGDSPRPELSLEMLVLRTLPVQAADFGLSDLRVEEPPLWGETPEAIAANLTIPQVSVLPQAISVRFNLTLQPPSGANGTPPSVALGEFVIEVSPPTIGSQTVRLPLSVAAGLLTVIAQIEPVQLLSDPNPDNDRLLKVWPCDAPPSAHLLVPPKAHVGEPLELALANLSDPDDPLSSLDIAWQVDFVPADGPTPPPVIGSGPTMTVTPGAIGYANVRATVSDRAGRTVELTSVVDVLEALPSGTILIGPAHPTVRTPVTLAVHLSNGSIETVTWRFSDGGTDQGVSVTRLFEHDGAYEVTATLHFVDGTEPLRTELHARLVVENLPPTAVASLDGAAAGLLVSRTKVPFLGAASADPDDPQTALTFAWDFGDGVVSDEVNPWHAFSRPGYHKVTLVVTDDDGASDRSVVELRVANQAPTALITGLPDHIDSGTVLQLNGTSSRDPDGEVVHFAWRFGDDGAAPNGSTVSHRFSGSGLVEVQLTVTDQQGAQGIQRLHLQVRALIPPTDESTPPTGPSSVLLAAAAILLAVVALLALVALRRKRAPQTTAPSPATARGATRARNAPITSRQLVEREGTYDPTGKVAAQTSPSDEDGYA